MTSVRKLLDVIEHDSMRLDRLVSDISSASRLDSELVKEEEEAFDLLKMVRNLTQYPGRGRGQTQASTFIADLPDHPVEVMGLEARLAQVFVNLITNAISFCEDGDAIRVWARRRKNRVLVVVEDTGPGIPDRGFDQNLSTLLFRTSRAAVWQQLGPRAGDFQTDRRGAWRCDLG